MARSEPTGFDRIFDVQTPAMRALRAGVEDVRHRTEAVLSQMNARHTHRELALLARGIADAARLSLIVPGRLALDPESLWGAYECLPCRVVFDVRFDERDAADSVACPLCGELVELRARWQATEGGYGSRGGEDCLFNQALRWPGCRHLLQLDALESDR